MSRLFDRSLDTIAALIDRFTARVDYFALYAAVVVSQTSDFLFVDVQPDSKRLPGMSHIPVNTGVPGFTAQVSSGSRVLIGWYDGDPRRPFAALWSSETAEEIVATCDDIRLGTKYLLPTDGVLTGQCTDQITGLKYSFVDQQSRTVKAKGPG